ncbi:hypothetical protein [Streptomyces sp. NPDC054765]
MAGAVAVAGERIADALRQSLGAGRLKPATARTCGSPLALERW